MQDTSAEAPAGVASDNANRETAAAASQISCSRGLAGWLQACNISLAFTSYQTGLLYLVGVQPNGVLSVNQVGFARAMGLWATSQRLYLAVNAQVCRSDIINGWRDRRADSGIIIDLRTDKTLAEQLSMPHSPRLWNGTLWVLDSGRGFLCKVDRKTGGVEQHAFLPGFLRGLAFHGHSAVVGLSLPREKSFAGLDLDDNLKTRDGDPWCGIQIIDLNTGNVQQWLRLEGQVRELFDVAVIPGVRCPMGVSPQSREFAATISRVDEFGSLDGMAEPAARATAA